MKQGAAELNGKPMQQDEEKQLLVRHDSDGYMSDTYDEPLPCFGYGIGWFCFILGIPCPLLWYYATYLYLQNYSRKQPRERTGLGACAIAEFSSDCSVAIVRVITWGMPTDWSNRICLLMHAGFNLHGGSDNYLSGSNTVAKVQLNLHGVSDNYLSGSNTVAKVQIKKT